MVMMMDDVDDDNVDDVVDIKLFLMLGAWKCFRKSDAPLPLDGSTMAPCHQ